MVTGVQTCALPIFAQVATESDAWNLQLTFYRTEVLSAATPENMDTFMAGVAALNDMLTQYHETHLDTIALTTENQTFLHLVQEMVDTQIPPDMAYLVLSSDLQGSAS